MKFDRHISSSTADVPVKFQSDWTILNTNLAASRLCKILEDVLLDIETGPWVPFRYKDCLSSYRILIIKIGRGIPTLVSLNWNGPLRLILIQICHKRCHLHGTLSPLPECCGLGIGHLWMISTGAQSMDGWQCPKLGWGEGVPVHPGLMVLLVATRGSWCNKQPNSHAGKTLFFMINCHLKFQIVCVCVFCFNSSRQSESHICIN